MRWVKMDPARVVTTGAFLDKVDLSKVDEFGWSDFMTASGHGQGGWSDVGKIEALRKGRTPLNDAAMDRSGGSERTRPTSPAPSP